MLTLEIKVSWLLLLRFHRFHACGCCAPGYADTFPFLLFLLVTLTDTMRSTDVPASRDTGLLTRTFPIPVLM